MFALLGHKWHLWPAWTVVVLSAASIQLLILLNCSVALAKEDCSSGKKDFNVIISKTGDESLMVPECFSRRCQYHRQCSSDCPNTFCSEGGRCLCESGFQVDLTTQSCLKELPLWLMLTVMGSIFAVAYLITFCCLKHDLLLKLKQLRPEMAVHFSAVNQRQPSSTTSTTAHQRQRRPSLGNESISSSSSSSLNDTFTQCASTYQNASTIVPMSGSAASVYRKHQLESRPSVTASQTYAINSKGHSSTANYENITPQPVSSTEI